MARRARLAACCRSVSVVVGEVSNNVSATIAPSSNFACAAVGLLPCSKNLQAMIVAVLPTGRQSTRMGEAVSSVPTR